jgi:hypothetical protein
MPNAKRRPNIINFTIKCGVSTIITDNKKMKTTITCILTLAFSINVFGLTFPDCNDLTVENIQMDDDTVNLMKVTISNSCSTCAIGVYCDLRVIKTVSPFDTIAFSDCYCLSSPDNSSQKTYLISSTVSSLPPITDIRVSFYGLDCDTIPYRITLGENVNIVENCYSIFPNPFSSATTLQTTSNLKNATLTICNSYGQTVKQVKNISGQTVVLSRDNLPSGLYFIQLTQVDKKIKADKLVITD